MTSCVIVRKKKKKTYTRMVYACVTREMRETWQAVLNVERIWLFLIIL